MATTATSDLLQPTSATAPSIERAHSPRLPSRPVRLIRNLHANYFSASKRKYDTSDSPPDSTQNSPTRLACPYTMRPPFASNHTSAIGQAIATLQRTVYAFGASTSIVGCCALLFQSCEGHASGPKLWIQLAYYGLFAAACSWQCIAPAYSSPDEPPSALPPKRTPQWTIGCGALSLLSSPFLTMFSSSSSIMSLVSTPLVAMAQWAPMIVAPLLYGLGTVSAAAEKDQDQHQQEIYKLKEHHEQAMETTRTDNLLRKNMLLETVGKEVQDAAALALESLRHMTPTSLFPPSIPREQLTPCTIPIPITSVLGLFTTLRHLQYIARNMQRLSRVLFTEYVQGIVEKTSPHYHRGDSGFDVGEFVQSLGDLISADASLKGIEFVIYHTEYELNHIQIKGSEDSWRHALINLIKSIMDWGKPGSIVELCLNLSALPQPTQTRTKVLVSFEITYIPNPAMAGDVDDLSELNALLASKLVKAMGGSLVIEETEHRGRRFIVAVEVELNTSSSSHAHRAGSSTPTLTEQQQPMPALSPSAHHHHHHLQDHSPVPSLPGSPRPAHITLNDLTLPPPRDHHTRASPSLDQRLEQLQTAHQEHPSRQYYEQHLAQHSKLRTPMASPSAIPASPSPRKSGGSGAFGSGSGLLKVSQEPTVQDLLKFSRKLSGVRIVLWAKESSAFAMRLSGYLRAWGIQLTQMDIPEGFVVNGKVNNGNGWATTIREEVSGSGSGNGNGNGSNVVFSPVPKRSASNSSLSSQTGRGGNDMGETHSASSTPTGATSSNNNSNLPPMFILIDDDVNVLNQQIMRLQATAPMSPSSSSHGNNTTTTKRSSHRRTKSISSIQQTHIIYFTSLPTFKQAREAIMTVLGVHTPGFMYNIMSTPPTPGSNVPYILVLPKPAGPRRILTAIHTAINTPVMDQHEEANPIETANVWIDPDTKLAYAGRPSAAAVAAAATAGSSGSSTVTGSTTTTGTLGGSPGHSPAGPAIQTMRQETMQRLIDAGANQTASALAMNKSVPVDGSKSAGSPLPAGSPKGMPTVVATTTGNHASSGSIGSATNIGGSPAAGTGPAGTAVGSPGAAASTATAATTAGPTAGAGVYVAPARAIPSPTPQMQNYKRRSGSIARVTGQTVPGSGEGIVVVPNANAAALPFSVVSTPAPGHHHHHHQHHHHHHHRASVGSDGSPSPMAESSGRRTPSFPFTTMGPLGSGVGNSGGGSGSAASSIHSVQGITGSGNNNSSSSNSSVTGHSTSSTPLSYMQSASGEFIISPPMARHTSMSSTVSTIASVVSSAAAASSSSSSSSPMAAGRASLSLDGSVNGPSAGMQHPTSPFVSPGLERALSTTPMMESPTTSAFLESAAALRSPGSPAPRLLPTSPMAMGKPRVVATTMAGGNGVNVVPAGGAGGVDGVKARPAPSAAKKGGVVERVSPLINVLIVEDNIINQRVLVKFMQQKHIKYDVASNGEEAVNKWKVGGFHLILMDIQMPVMDGIEATRMIREMERVQRIGVTGSTYSSSPDPEKMGNGGALGEPVPAASPSTPGDKSTTDSTSTTPSTSSPAPGSVSASYSSSPFKSPVIIVALTAAAKNDDTRDRALAAGCNDFITKPVTSSWLERKIVDWGCMQALIDVEGWKKWKLELEASSSANSRRAAAAATAAAAGATGATATDGATATTGAATTAATASSASAASPATSSVGVDQSWSWRMRSIRGLKPPVKKDKEREKEKEKEREKEREQEREKMGKEPQDSKESANSKAPLAPAPARATGASVPAELSASAAAKEDVKAAAAENA
ncbi:ssk1 response regulator receiver [Actinomortierella ambigua]|nr:ssk1 response regulator receiver [Actinomortierella ambigua]